MKKLPLLVLFCCLSMLGATAADQPRVPLKLEALHKHIKPKEGLIILGGEVLVAYQDTELRCDRAVIFQKSKEVYVAGNVMVKGQGALLQCEEAVYSWDEQKGVLRKVRFSNLDMLSKVSLFEADTETRLHVSAAELRKSADGEYGARDLSVSSCGHAEPHWAFKSGKATYTKNESDSGTVRSWHNVLYAGKVPVFYVPYMWLNTANTGNDYPWVKVRGGKSSTWGYYGLAKVGVGVTPETFIYTDIDARENWGMGLGLGYEIENSDVQSEAHIYGSSESWKSENKSRDERWRFKLEHRQRIDDEWGMQAELNTQSDEDMLYDYFRNESNEQDDNENSLAVYQNARRSYFEVYSEVRPDEWESKTEYLPELRYFYLPRQLGWGGIFYLSENRAGYLRRKEDDDLDIPHYEAARADTYHELNRPFSLFDIFTAQVYGGYRGSFYSRAQDSNDQISRTQGSWGAQLTYRSYALFDYHNKGFNINSLRHVIEPSLAFDSLEDPTAGSTELLQFDALDELEHNRILTMRIDNIFQTKRRDSHGEESVFDLLDWRLERKYFATRRAREIHNNGLALGNFFHQLNFTPTSRIRFFNDIEYDSRAGRIDIYSVRLRHQALSKRWDYQIEQRFERDDHNHLAFSINGKLSRIYQAGFVIRQDWDQSNHREYGLSLARANHCWSIGVAAEYNELTNEKQFSLDIWPNFFANRTAQRYSLW